MNVQAAKQGWWAQAQRGSVERLHIRLESFVVLLVLCAAMAVLSPFFLSVSNFLNILLATSTIGVLAIAATFVIGSGGLDLSLGSVMGLAGVVGAFVAVNLEAPSLVGLAACIVAGAIAGYINGVLITRAFVPAFIVTLGMLGLARGFALVICGGRVDLRSAAADGLCRAGPAVRRSDAGLHAGVDRHHRALRARLYALRPPHAGARRQRERGARRRHPHRTAPPARSTRCRARWPGSPAWYSWRASIPAIRPPASTIELTAITAAIIGGTNLFGGRGSILGTMIGALIMGVLQNGLNLLAVQSYYQQMAIGAVLILAVFIDQYQIRKESRV